MTPEPFDRTDPAGAKQLAETHEATIVDVRSVGEFLSGHIPGSLNIPIADGTPPALVPNPDFLDVVQRRFQASDKLVLVCRSGVRSAHACELLSQVGYSDLTNLEGGFHGSPEQPGWATVGFEQATEAAPGCSWDELSRG